ncbi:hypothetical protein EMIHUDRAFT_109248 [Emiliania huxleyi CCMP1516]|uniref:Cyclin-like domain-containing protein n=2 Tax=Emiliania huxleyi TaxID=2903 RepID=A0A0D3KS17_EMIH1|nr:hypothetical protein EMIHUDRAFT_109248 [Emiliania huxleyi CCMP1516]EOD38552.1 hypothetical protein EMIHUDRAFT_109248 [Emiliania huxleyi CCMP1516]|eukprot:XP_005790981.1 hypothetical protein EMIHUDRAFT_109248 [Emiliania huxleyi CCMP1516]
MTSAATAPAPDAESDDTINGQRVYGCELIQQMGIMLALPQVGIATAQVMFHRFYARRSMRRFDVRHVATGALFLATKVEECPRKVRDVLGCFQHLLSKRAGKRPVPLDIFSQDYANLKDKLIRAEREILKELGFILYSEHPHKFILNYAAWNFINDSQRTDACIKFAPEADPPRRHPPSVGKPPPWRRGAGSGTTATRDGAIGGIAMAIATGATGAATAGSASTSPHALVL